jgi:hypothetical protein
MIRRTYVQVDHPIDSAWVKRKWIADNQGTGIHHKNVDRPERFDEGNDGVAVCRIGLDRIRARAARQRSPVRRGPAAHTKLPV